MLDGYTSAPQTFSHLEFSLARWRYSTKKYMIHLIHFEREEGVMLVQVDRSPIIAACIHYLVDWMSLWL